MKKNDLVNEKEDEPLGFDQLGLMLGHDKKYCNFYMYDTLRTVTPAQFYSKPCSIILLRNRKTQDPTGHFFAMIQHRNEIEHFDSYGFNIDKELEITGEPDYIKKLLNETGKRYVESKHKFQSMKNDSETCGRWCVARVRMRDLLISEFIDFFEKPVVTKDQKVTLLTYFLG